MFYCFVVLSYFLFHVVYFYHLRFSCTIYSPIWNIRSNNNITLPKKKLFEINETSAFCSANIYEKTFSKSISRQNLRTGPRLHIPFLQSAGSFVDDSKYRSRCFLPGQSHYDSAFTHDSKLAHANKT